MPFCTIREVLISDSVHESCASVLSENGINVTTKTGLTERELIQEIKKYDGLIVRSVTKVTKKVIDAADNLKVIGRAGTGVDNIDCDAATLRGILVINAPGGNAISATELTCAMLLSLARNIPLACASLKKKHWQRKDFVGTELIGKTLGIVGLGRIGREVATRMQSFGMKTIGYDPIIPAEVTKSFGVESFELEQLWPQCDYITVHTPLIPQTKNLIDAEVLRSKCKKGVKIINCARGGIVDEMALFDALMDGYCGGAGLDVYLTEPPILSSSYLVDHPKVVCTPHIGANTEEAQIRVAKEIAEQFVDLGKGKYLAGIVNCPTLSDSYNVANQPWVSLSIQLGKLMGNVVEKDSKISGNLTLYGDSLMKKERMLNLSASVGLLEGQSIKGANFINASVLAKNAGIEVKSSYGGNDQPNEAAQSCSSVMLTATTESGVTRSLVATLQNDTTFLCAMDGCGFRPAIPLAGKLIFCHGAANESLAVKVITHLTSLGRVYSAFMSTPSADKMWCVIKVDADVPDLPSELSDVIDFWAEVDF